MIKIVVLGILIIFIAMKYRILGQVEKGPIEGKVLFPRQDANFVHGAMTALEVIFVLEFISHPSRDTGAVMRLGLALTIFIAIDVIYWLKLVNTSITYNQSGFRIKNMWGTERAYEWRQIREVRSDGLGMKQARYLTIKTTDQSVRINEKSGGMERFRRFMEENI